MAKERALTQIRSSCRRTTLREITECPLKTAKTYYRGPSTPSKSPMAPPTWTSETKNWKMPTRMQNQNPKERCRVIIIRLQCNTARVILSKTSHNSLLSTGKASSAIRRASQTSKAWPTPSSRFRMPSCRTSLRASTSTQSMARRSKCNQWQISLSKTVRLILWAEEFPSQPSCPREAPTLSSTPTRARRRCVDLRMAGSLHQRTRCKLKFSRARIAATSSWLKRRKNKMEARGRQMKTPFGFRSSKRQIKSTVGPRPVPITSERAINLINSPRSRSQVVFQPLQE